MKKLLTLFSFMVLLTVLFSCKSSKDTIKDDGWQSIFNGKDLTGWTVKMKGFPVGENFNNTFRVEDGLLTVSYDQYDHFNKEFGHLFYNDKLSHYKLRLTYRFIGDQVEGGEGWAFRNSGIMLHGQTPQSMGVNQDFPVSIEAQILGGNGTDPRPTGNVCTPGTNIVMNGDLIEEHCIDSDSKTYHGDQWVTMEVEVHGSESIAHFVNGEEVLTYQYPQYDPRDKDAQKLIGDRTDNLLIDSGYISLQAESHPIQFKNIEVLKLACDH